MQQTPPKSSRKTILADAGLFYAAAVWGATFFIIKSALDGVDPVVMVGYRFLLAGLLLLAVLIYQKKPVLDGIGRAFFMSVILWMLHVPQTVGLVYTTASNSGLITGLFVAFVPVFLVLVFRRRPGKFDVMASVISLAGLWVLTGGMSDVNVGDLITLVGAMAYALHVLYSDKYMKSGVDPVLISCQQFVFVGLMSLATALVLGRSFEISTSSAWRAIVFVALFPTLSAFVIQMFAQRITEPLKVSLIFASQPVFAAMFAWTLGGEDPVLHRALGGILIVVALIVASLSQRSNNRGRNTGFSHSGR